MKARTRWPLTLAAVAWIGAVAWSWPHLPAVWEWLVGTVVVPWVWLMWSFTRWSAHQHADREARAIEKVHGGRPRPLPERVL